MPIVLFLGQDVKGYIEISGEIIFALLSNGKIICEQCLRAMKRHSSYLRCIKETGQEIAITVVWCSRCRKWHALLPDFLLPRKHYSGDEIEAVMAESETAPAVGIGTKASLSTVLRWIKQIGDRIRQAVGILKILFGREGRAVSETAIDAGPPYGELVQILKFEPEPIDYSGNELGLANIWLGRGEVPAYI